MAVYADEPSLTAGKGFFLEPNGRWSVKDIPDDVVEEAAFSGYLTIKGFNSMVFEMPGGQMWAQKSSNTPADDNAKLASIAKRIAGTVYPLEKLKEWEDQGFFINDGSKKAKEIIQLAKMMEDAKRLNPDDMWTLYLAWDDLQEKAKDYIGFTFPEIF